MLNRIHVHHVSTNLNSVKPQSNAMNSLPENVFLHSALSLHILDPALENCEETNSRGPARTGIAWLEEKR